MSSISKKGMVSLETAISFSLVVVFITAIISVASFLRTDILMQRAVEQSCEDIGHFMPLSIIASDYISTLVNALPDTFTDTEAIEKTGAVIAGLDIYTSGALRSEALNLLIGQRFADDIASEYADYNGSSFFGPQDIWADFDIYDFYIEVTVTYSVNTIIGPMQRQIISTIPFYGDFELFLSDEEGACEDGNDIWHQNNFVRGKYFAEKYGANLPHTFPTINYYSNGRIASIVSIDLNRPTYSTPAACIARITGEIDKIAAFDGADVMISGTRYYVPSYGIYQRNLIVVIPSDSPQSCILALNSMEAYALSHGVNLQIIQDGTSG